MLLLLPLKSMTAFQAEWKFNSRHPCWTLLFFPGLSAFLVSTAGNTHLLTARQRALKTTQRSAHTSKSVPVSRIACGWWKHILNYLLDGLLSQCVWVFQGTMASLIPEAHDAWCRMYGHSSQKPRQASFVWENMQALFLYTGEGFVNFYITQKYTAESQEFPKWASKNILNQRGKNQFSRIIVLSSSLRLVTQPVMVFGSSWWVSKQNWWKEKNW